jgi:hypothetical protein
MTIQELRYQVQQNMEACKKELAAGNMPMAETYLSYANKATMIMLGKEPPEESECMWDESGVGCWNCTKLHCTSRGKG